MDTAAAFHGRTDLDAQLGATPVALLGIVSTETSQWLSCLFALAIHTTTTTYRILLSVRWRIHMGRLRFCFCFLARIRLVRNVLFDGYGAVQPTAISSEMASGQTWHARTATIVVRM